MKAFFLIILLIIALHAFSLTFEVPILGYSAGSLDIENDGDIDLVIGHATSFNDGLTDTLTIMINDENMNFSYFFIEDSLRNDALCVGYFDSDDYSDIITGAINGYTKLFINDQSGSFLDREFISEEIGATMLATCDVEGDGDDDIFYANSNIHYGEYFGFLLNDGNGNFVTHLHSDYGATDGFMDIGDIDQDGLVDVLVGSRIFYNRVTYYEEQIVYVDVPGHFIESTNLGDFDGDGDLDVLLQEAGYPGSLHIARNDSNQEFTLLEYVTDLPTQAWLDVYIKSIDLNNDNFDDLVYYEHLSIHLQDMYNHILINNHENNYIENSVFLEYTGLNPSTDHYLFTDIDIDNDTDIIIYGVFPTPDLVDEPTNYIIILFNDGYGNFTGEFVSYENETISYDNNSEVRIYPNPFNVTSEKLYYKIKMDNQRISNNVENISIYNIKGRKIFSKKVIDKSSTGYIKFDDKSLLNSGVYFAKFTGAKVDQMKKIVILK